MNLKSISPLFIVLATILLLAAPASAQMFQRLEYTDTEVYDLLVMTQAAVEDDPEDIEALLARGEADLVLINQMSMSLGLNPSQGAFLVMAALKEAEESYNAVLEEDPDNVEALLGLGYLELAGENSEGLVPAFERVLEEDPENIDARVGLCVGLFTKFDSAALALSYQEEILELDPTNSNGQALGIVLPTLMEDEPLALETLDAVLDSNTSDSAFEITILAGSYLILKISTNLEEDTNAGQSFDSFGSLMGITGLKESMTYVALQCLEEAVALHPDDFFANFGLGFTRLLLEENEEGIASLEKAYRIKPDLAMIPFAMGMAEFLDDDYETALSHLQQTGRMVPKNTLANSMIMLLNAAQVIPIEEIENAANEASPEEQETIGMAMMLAQTDYMNSLETIVEENPDDPIPHVNLGQALLFVGQTDEARKEYQAALRVDSDNVEANRGLAAIHMAKAYELLLSPLSTERDTEDAHDEIATAAELDPQNLTIQTTLLKFDAVVEAKNDFMDMMMRAYLESMEEAFGDDDGG